MWGFFSFFLCYLLYSSLLRSWASQPSRVTCWRSKCMHWSFPHCPFFLFLGQSSVAHICIGLTSYISYKKPQLPSTPWSAHPITFVKLQDLHLWSGNYISFAERLGGWMKLAHEVSDIMQSMGAISNVSIFVLCKRTKFSEAVHMHALQSLLDHKLLEATLLQSFLLALHIATATST